METCCQNKAFVIVARLLSNLQAVEWGGVSCAGKKYPMEKKEAAIIKENRWL